MKRTARFLSVALSVILLLASISAFAEPAQITLYQFQGTLVEPLRTLCEEFNQSHPDIQVVTDRPGDDYFNILKTMFASNQGPDIFSINAWTMVADYANAGIALDLTGQPFLDNVVDGAMQSVTVGDKVYALPFESAGLGVIYNKDIFEKYDLQIPKTISELESVCKTLKENGIAPFVAPMKETWILRHLWSMLHTQTVDIVEFVEAMKNGEASFKSDKSDDLFRVLDIWGTYCQENPFDCDYNMACAMFGKGEAAMFTQGLWVIPVAKEMNPDLRTGMFPLPISENPEDPKLSVDNNSVYCINADSKNVEACLTFFNWLAEKQNAQRYADLTTTLPVIKDVEIYKDADGAAEDIVAYANEGKTCPWGFSVWPTGFDDECGSLLQTYYTGELDKDGLLARFDEVWMDYIAE